MAKRLDTEQLRVLVRSRATKGSAFMEGDYNLLQHEWKRKLICMTREEIFEQYPLYTYDIKKDY